MRRTIASILVATALTLPACDGGEGSSGSGDTDGSDEEETELITSVVLTFTAEGAEPIVAAFRDPDGDGGASGTADAITLAADTEYAVSVEFLNELEEPPEDIGLEVADEAEDHQVFLYGSAVSGPAATGGNLLTHAYADTESSYGPNAVGEDLPLGLQNTITTASAGEGELEVMLRHLPELNGAAQKSSDLAMLLASGGALPGESDANVRFDVTVQ